MESLKIGHKIKKLRELRNFTQEYMADQLEMSQTGYSKIERDETDVSIKRVQQIAQILQASLADILNFDEKMVFNFSHTSQNQANGIVFQNDFSERERELYERQIAQLKEEIAHLRSTVAFLQGQWPGK